MHTPHPSNKSAVRVVITGMGAVTNLGTDARSTWAGMREGRSGISKIEGEDFAAHESKWTVRIGGQIKNWTPGGFIEPREVKRLDRFALLGMAAANEAVLDSGINFGSEDPERCGVIVGSGIGGIRTIEEGCGVMFAKGPDRLSPFTVPRLMVNAATGNISILYGLQGPATAHATACASSGHAIGDAIESLRRGKADVMIAGGAEAAISPLCIGAFMTMRALSTRNDDPTRASRPFDRARDGFVLAEGAAMFVLETEEHARKRGANILAELVGHGNSSDATHITSAGFRRARCGPQHAVGPRGCGVEPFGHHLRELARHQHPLGRQGRGGSGAERVRRPRPQVGGWEADDEFDQEHARTRAGGQRGGRDDRVHPRRARWHRGPDDQSRLAG